MPKWRKWLLALLMVCLLAQGTALADLRKGDSGYEVTNLQTLLFESGFLFELPDGSFGPRTEKAVKSFQKFAGMKQTGVVTDEVMEKLEETWRNLMVEIYGEEFFYTEGEYRESDGKSYPYACNMWASSDSSIAIDYCWRHADLVRYCEQNYGAADEESLRQERMLWKNEIMSLYDQWADCYPEEARGKVEAARAVFLANAQIQFDAVDAFYQNNGAQSSYAAECSLQFFMRNHAAWLCNVISGFEGAGEEMEG